jgi:two-component system sensor histidine kinase KdpD
MMTASVQDGTAMPDTQPRASGTGGGRGRLTLFLGAVPGVATASMAFGTVLHRDAGLRDADVAVLGSALSTDRSRRLRNARERLEHAGRLIEAYTLDEVLAAAPAAVMVEDLTEVNPGGARHANRLGDMDDLLASGIDVYAAVGVTQLVPCRDLVHRLTGILPRNLLPETILDRADVLELVDVPAASLIERYHAGDVALKRGNPALFTAEALEQLRNLALSLIHWKHGAALAEGSGGPPWDAGASARVLVLLTRGADPERVARAGHRLAEASQAPLTVAYAEDPGGALCHGDSAGVADALHLAETLGAEIVAFAGDGDTVETVMEFARTHRVGDIVLGRPAGRGLRRLLNRPLADRLIEVAGDVGVHMLGDADAAVERMAVTWRIDERRPWFHEYVVSAAATFVAAGLIRLAQPLVPPETLSIVMLMAVIYAATAFGFAAALFASLLGVILFNFFFIPPRFDFIVTTPENVLLLSVFVVMAGVTSNLAGRLHDQATMARRRERNTASLFRLAREVATAPTADDVLRAVVRQLNEILSVSSVLLLPRGGPSPAAARTAGADDETQLEVAQPGRAVVPTADHAAAAWVYRHGYPAGPGTGTHETASCLLWPLRTPDGTVGVVAITGAAPEVTAAPQFRRRLDSLCGIAAVAIERIMLTREIESARFTAQTESLRAALLSSISHDLRTPLASIIGSATSLLSFGRGYDEEVKSDLLRTILEEAERLNRFVGNLLQMTKLESGAITPKRQWIDVDDLIGTTLERLDRRLESHNVVADIDPLLPPLHVDFVLMENVVTNLLDNAVKYSPHGSTITIRGFQRGDTTCISVTDQGMGIAPEDHAHVFDKFFRVYARDSVVAGTGLGLAICKGIVETHGGTVELTSDGVGQGATFCLCLPTTQLPRDIDAEGCENA